jgi:chemotaxis protein methyltransferase CheR
MRFYAEALNLQENVFLLLRDLIHQRTGLFFESAKRNLLADKLSPLVIDRGFTSFLDYYYLLKYDSDAGEEWDRVVDTIATQETFFWREFAQVQALVDRIVPEFFASRSGEPLRIWSAACATGEEPLSIAMALNEAGWLDRAPIEIYGSDASPAAVSKARKGVYRERSFRNLPSHLRSKYFVERDGNWHIVPEMHERVRWATANLMDESQIAPFANASVIFCRNVFIYFSESTIRRTVELFHRRISTPGYLFVGVSESLFRLTSLFELMEIGEAFVYIKK